MAAFDYLSILISIIVGLAITQILQGYRGLALARRRLRMFWPAAIWSIVVLLIAVQSWWAMFGLREVPDWTFGAFSIVLLQAAVLYMLAALVLPEFAGDDPIDLETHYFSHHRLFFGALALLVAVSVTKDRMISGHLPSTLNLAFQGPVAGGAILAAITKRELYHRLFAPAVLIALLAYITILFARLP